MGLKVKRAPLLATPQVQALLQQAAPVLGSPQAHLETLSGALVLHRYRWLPRQALQMAQALATPWHQQVSRPRD